MPHEMAEGQEAIPEKAHQLLEEKINQLALLEKNKTSKPGT